MDPRNSFNSEADWDCHRISQWVSNRARNIQNTLDLTDLGVRRRAIIDMVACIHKPFSLASINLAVMY